MCFSKISCFFFLTSCWSFSASWWRSAEPEFTNTAKTSITNLQASCLLQHNYTNLFPFQGILCADTCPKWHPLLASFQCSWVINSLSQASRCGKDLQKNQIFHKYALHYFYMIRRVSKEASGSQYEVNIVTTYSTHHTLWYQYRNWLCKTKKQTFPPRPAGLEKPRRSFTEALVVFCREPKHRHAEIWDNMEDKANPTTLQLD